MSRTGRLSNEEPEVTEELTLAVRQLMKPLRGVRDLDPLMSRIGDKRFALLGEASHGTSDYYRWRTKISQRLITEKNFSFIAVEGDWPDCYRVNRYVKGYPGSGSSARAVLEGFRRWPTWMWANAEVVELVEWLRLHNNALPEARKVGFYGLDVYSLWESLEGVVDHVRKHHPEAIQDLLRVVHCFQPYGEDAIDYARATKFYSETCEAEVVALLAGLRQKQNEFTFEDDGGEAHFVAEQNAHILKNAEAYYRSMVRGGPESWNLRDTHMTDTLDRLMVHYDDKAGDGRAKGIVWEHNTHIGDARFTDMAAGSEVNVGQLIRERHGESEVMLVGFTTNRGSVVAGNEWEAPEQIMKVPKGRSGSWEDVLHRATGGKDGLMVFEVNEVGVSDELAARRGHRAIGVVYRPEFEHRGNYVPTVLPRRYDAVLYIDETAALHPLGVRPEVSREPPETYPSSM